MYWKFLLLLFGASIIMPFAYAILTLPSTGIALLVGKLARFDQELSPKVPTALKAIMLLGGVWTFLVLTLWAGYCAGITVLIVIRPGVTQDWFYYLTAFVLFVSPLEYMASKEPSDDGSFTGLWILLMSVVFVAFCIWPTLMSPSQRVPRPVVAFALGGEIGTQEASPEVIKTLKDQFMFDEVIELLHRQPTRSEVQQHFAVKPNFLFQGSFKQHELVGDNYFVRNPYFFAMQLYYVPPQDHLVGVMLVVIPIQGDAYARRLVKASLDSVEAPAEPPSVEGKLYFLGIHRLRPGLIVKINIREDKMPDGTRTFSIPYRISAE